MWAAVIIATIPTWGGLSSKQFTHELKVKVDTQEACEAHANSVARLGGIADIDPQYKIICRRVLG